MKKTSRVKKQTVLLAIILFLLLLAILYLEVYEPSIRRFLRLTPSPSATAALPSSRPVSIDGQYTVEFIDVGQADCVLVSNGPDTMLIDAGNNSDGPKLTEYLKASGVRDIDYLIGTHPHEDHIGGMDDIIANYRIGELILPKQTGGSGSYRDVTAAAAKKSLKVTPPTVGKKWRIGKAECTVLACGDAEKEDLNRCSVVIKMTIGKVSFLFTGDEETENEEAILASGADVQADFYKAAHHGSSSSNSWTFLEEVQPQVIVISVGADNRYGHPHREAMRNFRDSGARICRTDRDGTVIVVTDGLTYSLFTCRTDTDGGQDSQ